MTFPFIQSFLHPVNLFNLEQTQWKWNQTMCSRQRRCNHRLYNWSGCSHREVWHFGCHHFGFLEPEVTIFGWEGGAECRFMALHIGFTFQTQKLRPLFYTVYGCNQQKKWCQCPNVRPLFGNLQVERSWDICVKYTDTFLDFYDKYNWSQQHLNDHISTCSKDLLHIEMVLLLSLTTFSPVLSVNL